MRFDEAIADFQPYTKYNSHCVRFRTARTPTSADSQSPLSLWIIPNVNLTNINQLQPILKKITST